ncbi:MAG: hypothetical protein HYS57_01320, partial [Parcubacteria group bacterium]|nr:hypothetical protein [Parcubacteria group bacterium]
MHGLIPQLLILLGIGGGAILLVRKAKYVPDEGLRVVVETGEKLKIFWREAVANRFPKDEIEMK